MDSSCARSQADRRKALHADIASASATYSTITENDLIARMAELIPLPTPTLSGRGRFIK
jgi:hypothetical protein